MFLDERSRFSVRSGQLAIVMMAALAAGHVHLAMAMANSVPTTRRCSVIAKRIMNFSAMMAPFSTRRTAMRGW
ncbi:hypothetical protein ACFSUK_13460 [Sphingobium scionense]